QDLAAAACPQLMAYRGDEMSLTESNSSVYKERVVLLAGLVRDGKSSGVSELVCRPDHKLGKGITCVELRMAVAMQRIERRLNYRRRAIRRLVQNTVRVQAQSKFDLDYLAGLCRKRFSQEF